MRRRRAVGRFVRSAFIDPAPLRDIRSFRWMFAGQAGVQFSRHMLVVAVPFHAFVLTGSTLWVGLLSLAQVPALVLCALVGGSIADVYDRRRVVLLTQAGMVPICFALALVPESDASVWWLVALMMVHAGLFGIENPTRTAMIPSLVGSGYLVRAFALNQMLVQLARVVGPAVAGVVIAGAGLHITYLIIGVCCTCALVSSTRLPASRPARAGGRVSMGGIREGWRFLRGAPVLQQTMIVDLSAMVFGLPRALFPYIGIVTLGGDAATVGMLHSAPGVGALIGVLTTGWVASVRRQGRVVIVSIVLWSTAIALFGLATELWLALTLLALAGVADVGSNVFRATLLQVGVPDELRGRLTSFKVVAASAGPQLGDAEAGGLASVTSPAFAVVSGGLASAVATIIIAARGKALWRHTAEPESGRVPR